MNQSNIRILVLDDEPFMLKLLGRQLENLGFSRPSAYTNGHEALDALNAPLGAPDLILLDLNMPKMDGIEFVRQLGERRFEGSLILVSGEDERMLEAASTLVRAHGIRLLGHLKKPMSNEALTAVMKRWTSPKEAQLQMKSAQYDADTLKAAIANGELVNYYQPKVAVADGSVVGVETLARWRHPVDGLVFPDQFIGLAEAHGLIDALTHVVLSEALAQTRVWHDAGLALRVAVNLSMDNLKMLDFADFIGDQAAMLGVSPSHIVLEVTESCLMDDLRMPLDILTRLRLKRFRLSIDDFGTGHSSFAQLRDLPFNELKIDRGFVHRAWGNDTLSAIYNASLQLAHQLGMKVVAEGVEDQDDWNFLRRSGCDFAQGYFIARPMPAAELPAWIEGWKQRLRDTKAGLI